MRKCLFAALLVCLLCVACAEKAPPPPPTPPPPPEKTPEQIAGEIRPVLAPLEAVLVDDPSGQGSGEGGKGAKGGLAPNARSTVISGLTEARTKHQGSENGRQALAMIAHDLESITSRARDQKRWPTVILAIDAYELLMPGSTKMNRLKERAQLHLACPKVSVKGFMDDAEKKDVYVFLELLWYQSGESKSVQVKVGEEFDGLKLLDIVGDKKGVRIEYLAIPGEIFEVMKNPT